MHQCSLSIIIMKESAQDIYSLPLNRLFIKQERISMILVVYVCSCSYITFNFPPELLIMDDRSLSGAVPAKVFSLARMVSKYATMTDRLASTCATSMESKFSDTVMAMELFWTIAIGLSRVFSPRVESTYTSFSL